MTTPRQVACTPITPTLTRAQCTSHTEVVHVVSCGVEEIGEESGFIHSKPKPSNSCVAHHVVHRLTLISLLMCVCARGNSTLPPPVCVMLANKLFPLLNK